MIIEIIQFVKEDKTNLEYSPDSNDIQILLFETRANGFVGEEIHSKEDYEDALGLERRLQHNFGDSIDTRVETVDEWVMLYVTVN
mgnify:CR=1 FL=1